jgi:hypothetical protein
VGLGRERNFPRGAERPENRGQREDGADDERGDHDVRDAVRVDGVAVQAEQHEQRRREVRERLAEAGERALHEKAGGVLRGVELVADERAVRLHGDVVRRVENPEEAGGQPERRAERHEEKRDAGENTACAGPSACRCGRSGRR